MFQQYHTQVCEKCDNVKLAREQEEITVHVEPGMVDGHVSARACTGLHGLARACMGWVHGC